MPHGPVMIRLWRSAIHAQMPSVRLLAIELPGAGEVDGFERRRVAQLGRLQAPLELALLAGRPLGIDQQAEPLLEAERGGLVGVELLLEGVGHRAELRKRLG